MNQDKLKRAAAQAAIDYCVAKIGNDAVIGIGSGSTVHHFIELLAPLRARVSAAIASSEMTAKKLREARIPVGDLNAVAEVQVYVDGADEVNRHLELIKGGGGALTREKIVAAVAAEFVCIADASKWVSHLGAFPVAVEVITMARGHVARQIVKLGGTPVYRAGVVTDNGNVILDVHNLHPIGSARALEEQLNNIAGVVANGIFAARPADVLLLATDAGVKTLWPTS